MNDFRNVPAEQKREIGQALNELKNYATDTINALRAAIPHARLTLVISSEMAESMAGFLSETQLRLTRCRLRRINPLGIGAQRPLGG